MIIFPKQKKEQHYATPFFFNRIPKWYSISYLQTKEKQKAVLNRFCCLSNHWSYPLAPNMTKVSNVVKWVYLLRYGNSFNTLNGLWSNNVTCLFTGNNTCCVCTTYVYCPFILSKPKRRTKGMVEIPDYLPSGFVVVIGVWDALVF